MIRLEKMDHNKDKPFYVECPLKLERFVKNKCPPDSFIRTSRKVELFAYRVPDKR